MNEIEEPAPPPVATRKRRLNWDAISAVSQIVATVAVVGTLIYLAAQVRQANVQAELDGLRYAWGQTNQFSDVLAQSPDLAPIVLRGRQSLDSLDANERIRFESFHFRVLNTLEAWAVQLDRTTEAGPFRDREYANIAGVAEYYLRYPGTRDLWLGVRHLYPPSARALIDTGVLPSADPSPGPDGRD